jgi:hypothetical protein
VYNYLLSCPVLLIATLLAGFACADGQNIRRCDFEVKARCASDDARVTLADGAVIRVEVDAYWCALHGRPPFICTIDSSRSDHSSVWSEDRGSTLIDNASPWNAEQPDRVKVKVGRDVTIDLNETQSLGRCGAGAELPRTIVIPAQGRACQVWLRTP